MRMLPWVTECDILCGLGNVLAHFWVHLLWTISLMHQLLPHPLAVIADRVRPLHSVALLASLPFCQAPSSMPHDQAGAQTLEIRGTSALSIRDNSWSPMKGLCGKGVMPIKGDGGMMTESQNPMPSALKSYMVSWPIMKGKVKSPQDPQNIARGNPWVQKASAVFPAQGLGCIVRVISRPSSIPLHSNTSTCAHAHVVFLCLILFLWKIAHFKNNAHSQG